MKLVVRLAFIAFASTLFAAQMSHEEAVVRETFARLAYAAQITTVHKTVNDYDARKVKADQINHAEAAQRISAEEIQFQLSDFKVGPVSDLSKITYADLVTKPEGQDVLRISPGTLDYDDNGNKVRGVTAEAQWVPGQNLSENWNVPASTILDQRPPGMTFSRYADFHVTVKFQNKTRSYRAALFFGADSAGKPIVIPVDTVTGSSALNYFLENTVYPSTLLQTHLRQHPVVSEWLNSGQAVCSPGKACCDPGTLKCGISAHDMQAVRP